MNTAGLLPFQVEPAKCLIAALALHDAAIDASECGVGKTFHAAAVIRELVLPTLVVCPKISVTGWTRALAQMETEACIKNYETLATGRTPYGQWQHPLPPASERKWKYVCEGCQCEVDLTRPAPCRVRPSGIHCVNARQVPHEYGKFEWSDRIKFLVFDEVHRCGAMDSLNSEMLIAAKRQHVKTLVISATAADSPLGFKALGYVLGLHAGPSSFYHWARVRGCSRPVFGGLHFLVNEQRKKEIMAAIHHDLFPSRGVRVRVSDIPGFQACKIDAELFDLESSGKIVELQEQMSDAIALLNTMKLQDKNAEHPLTVLLRSAMEIELLKVPLFLALRQDALDEGKSVAIFVSYRQTLDELRKRTSAPSIYGGQCPVERQAAIDDFQAEREHTILANVAAGGVSVSLHHIAPGVRPRVGLCSIHPSAVKVRQVFGRLARAGGLSAARYRMILIAGTAEEKVHRRLSSKLNCLDALNDSDLAATNLPLTVGDLSEILTEAP